MSNPWTKYGQGAPLPAVGAFAGELLVFRDKFETLLMAVDARGARREDAGRHMSVLGVAWLCIDPDGTLAYYPKDALFHAGVERWGQHTHHASFEVRQPTEAELAFYKQHQEQI